MISARKPQYIVRITIRKRGKDRILSYYVGLPLSTTLLSSLMQPPASQILLPAFRGLVDETEELLRKQRQKGADYKFREGIGMYYV